LLRSETVVAAYDVSVPHRSDGAGLISTDRCVGVYSKGLSIRSGWSNIGPTVPVIHVV
jgi:hypothetical protein